jgi:hypothetical protein
MLKHISLGALLVTVALALPAYAANDKGNNGDGDGNGGSSRGAPGPIAGAGLPFLLIAGGYALVRRYRYHKAE